MTDTSKTSRRGFIAGALGVATALTAATVPKGPALAQKAPKKAVAYQPEPKDGARCDQCQFWVAPEGGEGPGACQIVQGDIAPEAWCNLWAKA